MLQYCSEQFFLVLFLLIKQHKQSEYNRRYRERHPDAMRKWRSENADHVREYNHDYGKANRPRLREQERERNHANKEQVNADQRAYIAANKDKVNAGQARRRLADPERYRNYDRKRLKTPARKAGLQTNKSRWRAAKVAAPINDLTAAQWREIQEAYDHRCAYCGKRRKGKLTQDHITPLSQGGNNTAANVIPACSSCNSRKGPRAVLTPVQPLLLTVAPSRKPKAS